jgi:hypothetical protein
MASPIQGPELEKALGEHPHKVMEQLRPHFLAVVEDPAHKAGVVGFGLGFKKKKGKLTKAPAITFFVERKLPRARVKKGALLPTTIESLKADVVETGPMSMLVDLTGTARPVQGGFSLGHSDGETGTAGCWAFEETPQGLRHFVLSNNHVIANTNLGRMGEAILQPGPLDWGTERDKVGTLTRWVELALHDYDADRAGMTANTVDAALCAIDADLVSEVIVGVGNVPTWRRRVDVPVGLAVKKTGRTTGTTRSVVQYIGATVYVGFSWHGVGRFDNQVVCGTMSSGGDSGALVLGDLDNSAVGLCFGGSLKYTVVNPIEDVQDQLGVRVARETYEP